MRHGKRHLPYKDMSKIRLFHVNKMAARFCSVNQQLVFSYLFGGKRQGNPVT